MNKVINDKEPLELPEKCYKKTNYGNGCIYPTCVYLDAIKKRCQLNACVRREFALKEKKN